MKTTNKDIIELFETGAYTEKEAYETSIKELHILNAHDQAEELQQEAIELGILRKKGAGK